ncbi:MAG: M24 family metallopeptidase, partial [Thermodesulfobacteriota bacterium]
FMGWPQPVSFVGHGVGLELDELPVIGKRSPTVLEEGMVMAIEPKFVFPGEGLAGIENTFLVTDKGLERLTLFDDAIQVVST